MNAAAARVGKDASKTVTGTASITETADNLPKLLRRNAYLYPHRPANREKAFGIWQSWNWQQVYEQTKSLAIGFHELGLCRGDRIAIIRENRPRLYWSMVAAQWLGAIPVPLYQDSIAEEMQFVLAHSGAKIAITENQEQVDKIVSIKDALPALEHVAYDDKRGLRSYDHARLHSIDELIRMGQRSDKARGDFLDHEMAQAKGSDICVILYTSGTTGKPKGVVLTNDNVLVSAQRSADFDHLTEKEEVLAYLPMAWVGDYIFSMAQAYHCGFCVSCPESTETMTNDLREIGPSYFFAPPRIFENILSTVMIRMEDASRPKRWLWRYFLDHAKKTGPAILDRRKIGMGARLLYFVGSLLIYGPLKNMLGFSRMRVGYTAGEAIGPEIFQFFRALGVNLKQLYGQTEACVFVAQQPDREVYPDTVGVPSPGVELHINPDNSEVMYRSAGVFREYFQDPETTNATRARDGWVHTGDAGFIDERTGHLRIIDRAKDVGRMNDGSMFAPKYIENKLKFYPFILEAVAFGDQRDYVCVMINIDLRAVGNWAERRSIPYASYQELAAHPALYDRIQEHIEEVNRSLAEDPYLANCQIRRFFVLHKELDADDGELTRTRKVRRRACAERYGTAIEALFGGHSEVFVETEVIYEDGRKGSISATLAIRDTTTYPKAPATRPQLKVA